MHSVHLLLKSSFKANWRAEWKKGPGHFFYFWHFLGKKLINNSCSFDLWGDIFVCLFIFLGGGEFWKQNHPPATLEKPLRNELDLLQQAHFVAWQYLLLLCTITVVQLRAVSYWYLYFYYYHYKHIASNSYSTKKKKKVNTRSKTDTETLIKLYVHLSWEIGISLGFPLLTCNGQLLHWC